MIIQACYSIFNEDKLLDLSLMSIADYVDKIVVVDGPYKGFKHTSLQSHDETYKVLKKYGIYDTVVIDEPLLEENKRSLYLTEGCDFYFQIDADEVIIGNIPNAFNWLSDQSTDIFGVRTVLPRNIYCVYPRIFRYKKGLHYVRSDDFTIHDGEGKLYSPILNPPIIPFITIINLEFLRSVERQEVWARYNALRTGLKEVK